MGRGFKGFYEYCSIIEILAAKSFRHFAEGIIMKFTWNDAFTAYLLIILKNIFDTIPSMKLPPSKFMCYTVQESTKLL